MARLFDRICRDNGITHRLTQPRSPTTTGRSSGSTPGNSIRNRREICAGNHHCSSQAQACAASCGQASLGVLGRRAYSWARWGAPGPVLLPAAVGSHLPLGGGDRLAQLGGDRGERVPACSPMVICSRSAGVSRPRPGNPAIVRTGRREACRTTSARPDANSPPARRSHAAIGPGPSAAAPAAAALQSDAAASATSSAHRESSRLTEALR
jgi:hypothetical protein